MARLRHHCVCGAEVDMRVWGVRKFDMGNWLDIHTHCVVAWQREHGYQSSVVKKDEDAADAE